ncbi:hypothetical protein [Sphingomonas daechungensis]|uniref:hypothetical protein n=1 Tax=Sphingomonas daechungensis TaxID=1176646 RepID=UPI003784C548
MALRIQLLPLALVATVGACGAEAPGIANRIETQDDRMKRQEAEFNASPDIKGDDLRRRLNALGIKDQWMSPAVEEHGVDIFKIRLPALDFARLDKRLLAKLLLDSRYRFELADEDQNRELAHYHGAELHERQKATALRELAERRQLNSYPRYREGMAMSAFAPRLEAWCGYEEGQALRVIDGKWVDYQRTMVDLAVKDKSDGRALASFDCMKRVVDATTELRRRFIGNRGREGAIDY